MLGAFLVGTAVGARLTSSRLVPGVQSSLARTPLLEASLLAAFALWLATGSPAGHATAPLALLVVGAAAVGLHAAIALAFHLPNVAIATEAVHARG